MEGATSRPFPIGVEPDTDRLGSVRQSTPAARRCAIVRAAEAKVTAAQEEQYAAVMQALEARPKYAPAQAQALRLRALHSCAALAEKRLMAWRHLDTWLNNLQAEAAIAIAEAEQGHARRRLRTLLALVTETILVW